MRSTTKKAARPQTQVEPGISHHCSPEMLREEGPDFIDFEAMDDYQPKMDDAWHGAQIVRILKTCGITPARRVPDYDWLEIELNVAGFDTYQSDTCFEVGIRNKRYGCDSCLVEDEDDVIEVGFEKDDYLCGQRVPELEPSHTIRIKLDDSSPEE